MSKDKSNQALKSHTFAPRSGGWYYCPQTGQRMRKASILSAMMQALNGSDGDVHLITPGAPALGTQKVKRKKG